MSIWDEHALRLGRLAAKDRRRSLIARAGADFASNDYLGLAQSAELRAAAEAALARGVPVGSGGSRLLRGNHPEHEALEAEAAAHFGAEAALFFASGFAANSALVSTLPERGDLIVHDALIHASAHEGMRLARAEAVAAAHNDADAFADAIAAWRARGGAGRAWIAVESLYSMDGDRAPLDALAAVAERNGAVLLIDEAHATGVFGPAGRGLAAGLEGRADVVTLRTLGKGLGCEGALVCGSRVMADWLVNRARGFIFSTAPSPLSAAVARASIGMLRDETRQRRLAALVERAGEIFEARLGVAATGSQIIPVMLGDNARAMRVAERVQAAGFDVRGIRPPTVPEGTARLRVSLTLNVDEDQVGALAGAIGEAMG